MDEPVLAQVGQLYSTPADSFVAARNELVKTLKRTGDREAAAAVGRLRRPSWIDTALSRVSRARPDLVEAFAAAAREAHRIQDDAAEGRRSGSLADALRAVRTAQSALATAADAELRSLGRPRDLAGATARLGEVGGDSTLLALLSAGVLGLEEESLADAFGARSTGPKERSPDPEPKDDVDDSDVALRRDVESAARAVRGAERDAGVAATAADRARDRRDRAAAAVVAAAEAVRAAQEELAIAERALDEHEHRLTEAERAAAEASAQVVAAARHHADLAARISE